MKPFSEVAPGLFVIQIQIQAVCVSFNAMGPTIDFYKSDAIPSRSLIQIDLQ